MGWKGTLGVIIDAGRFWLGIAGSSSALANPEIPPRVRTTRAEMGTAVGANSSIPVTAVPLR